MSQSLSFTTEASVIPFNVTAISTVATIIAGGVTVILVATFAIVVIKVRSKKTMQTSLDNKNGVELQENTAYAGVQKREAVDVKENSAYGMIPKTDTGKVDSTYDTVQSTQA
eukprot:Em0007g1335a